MKAAAASRRRTDSIDAAAVSRRRTNIYIGLFVLLFFGYFLLRGISWQGTKHLHTIMEVIATLLALAVGVLALIPFYSKKNNTILFIGAAFLGTAFLDGYHAVVTSAFFDTYFPPVPSSLIPWSWVASRFFLSLLYLSYLAWNRKERLGEVGRITEDVVYWAVTILTLASCSFFAFTPLPRAYYPEILFHRPEEFLPAFFFLLALIGFLKKGGWKHDQFEHWLVMSIIVGFMGQVMYMSFSGRLFDFMFDAAHLLKKVSYVLVLTGLLISMFRLFRQADESARELSESNERLEIVDRIARVVGSSLREKDLFPTIAREIRRIIPCERLFIGSVNFETEEIFYWHVESDVKVPPVDDDDVSRLEWYQELYEKMRPLNYGDIRKVPYRRAQDFAKAGLRSQLFSPSYAMVSALPISPCPARVSMLFPATNWSNLFLSPVTSTWHCRTPRIYKKPKDAPRAWPPSTIWAKRSPGTWNYPRCSIELSTLWRESSRRTIPGSS